MFRPQLRSLTHFISNSRFTTVLDSRKTGHIIKPSVLQTDRKHSHRKPVCLGGQEGADNLPTRPAKLGPFVLEELLDAGERIQNELLYDYEQSGTGLVPRGVDPDLLRPWSNIEAALRAGTLPDALKAEVEALRAHVALVRREWGKLWGSAARWNSTGGSAAAARQRKQLEQRKKAELARLYAQVPEGCATLALLCDVEKLKASYMYSLNPKIVLAFGFQALCKIKAQTAGSTAFTKEFAEAMSISGAEVRVRSQFNTIENFE